MSKWHLEHCVFATSRRKDEHNERSGKHAYFRLQQANKAVQELDKTMQKRKILYVNLEMNYWQIIRNLHLPLMYDSADHAKRSDLETITDVQGAFRWAVNPTKCLSTPNKVFLEAYKQKSRYVK
ncbi:MAG: hypothetical protein LE169_02795 [Endomicrobium sp.]|nr:hypothetical protein [Endomicrobium sp.]